MKVKPLPKLIAIVAIVGAIGYGANSYLQSRPQLAAPVKPQVESVTVTPPVTAPVEAPQIAIPEPTTFQHGGAPQPQPQPQPEVQQSIDAGMSRLLNAKK